MSKVHPSVRLLLPSSFSQGPMKAPQPDPPIQELRNRWPFFSEGELKWLLSPKKQGAGHSELFNEEMDSAMARIERSMQEIPPSRNDPSKMGSDSGICPEPEPTISPVAFALEGAPGAKESHVSGEGIKTSFSFATEKVIEGGEMAPENDHLGPRMLQFEDENVAGPAGTQNMTEVNRDDVAENDEKGVQLLSQATEHVIVTENAHANPYHMNPFAEGLEPLAGEDMQEQAPIVFVDPSFANKNVTDASHSDEYSTAPVTFFRTPPQECGDGYESFQEGMESDMDEEEAGNKSVKRMSFDLRDGKQIPKFVADDVLVALNCGGPVLENAPFGFPFTEDKLFTGGDVLRTDERISGVHESILYQTARYGDLSYIFKDLPNGNYVVDLHFAEIIFTNGPPGMRVFDISIQEEKVISELDVYDEVGSNNALILSVSTMTSDGTILVTFEGVIGSPTISAICIRSGPPTNCAESALKNQLSARTRDRVRNRADVSPAGRSATSDCEPLDYQQELQEKDREIQQITEHKARRQQMKNKARKCVREYEEKMEELKNECHEAWISLQDSNRMNETLRDDLCAKSLCVDSLATAVETQLSEMNAIKERTSSEKKRWVTAILNGYKEIQVMKREHSILAQETKEWVASLPDVTVMTTSVQSLVNEHQDLRKKYADECHERRQLYNKVLELKGNIRVFCRCRPLGAAEVAANAGSVAEFESAINGDLVIRNGTAGKKLFKFDRVFSPQDDQPDVFADTAPVVVSVLDGFNVCIFAYGQTGTGKTFTMEGCVENRGVNYRTLEELFNVAAQRKGEVNYEISVSVMEVYNEQIRDLLALPPALDQAPKKLEIKQMAEGGHHVPGLVEAQVTSMEEVWEVLQAGSSSRTVGSTRANDHSSRSHCMLCVMVKGDNTITGECTKSKLWLVDLAGSERVAKSDAQGDRLKEAQSINKSLSALGDVIQALTTKSSHIPFRNSKLTHLLQDSLGGDSKTLMFVQISPNEADVGETLCSLNFASRVRGVELGPAKKHLDSGELFKYKQLAERAKQEGRSKEDNVKRLEESLRTADTKLKAKEQTCQSLCEKVKENAELDAQLSNERRARQAAEASYREQKLSMEKLANESKSALEKLAEKAADETKQAIKEALDIAAGEHAKEMSRLRQQLQQQADEARGLRMPSPKEIALQTPAETTLRRPPLVETGSVAPNPVVERTPTLEYVVKPPDASEIMRNSCTGEVFGNENANPQEQGESADLSVKTKGILKSAATKTLSPTICKRPPSRTRRVGFGVSVKPSVLVNSLARRSQESASSNNSVANSLSEEDLQKLCGGLDMIATSNTSTHDASLQSLAQVLETTPTNWKGSFSRLQPQKTVHFRSPLLLPPREGARLDDLELKDNSLDMESKPVVTKVIRRTTLPAKPFGKATVGAGPQRVVAQGMKSAVPVLREKRWNK